MERAGTRPACLTQQRAFRAADADDAAGDAPSDVPMDARDDALDGGKRDAAKRTPPIEIRHRPPAPPRRDKDFP